VGAGLVEKGEDWRHVVVPAVRVVEPKQGAAQERMVLGAQGHSEACGNACVEPEEGRNALVEVAWPVVERDGPARGGGRRLGP